MSATIELMTYADAIDHLIDFQRANPSAQHNRIAKRAILLAYQNFRNDHQWPYYYARGRVCTEQPYTTGTVTYDRTGGGIEREMTLADGIWPDWAEYGTVIIGSTMYQVAARFSDTVIQLDIDLSPGMDLTSPQSYTLMRHTYPLPSDFVNVDKMYTPDSWQEIQYVHPREWMESHRRNITSASTPTWYTVIGSTEYMGALSLGFYPFPDTQTSIDYLYQRRARPLRVDRIIGTLNATEGNTYADYSEGALFRDEHIGSIIRLSDTDGTDYPTGREGESPYSEERTVMDVSEDGTQVSVDQAFLRQHSNAKFVISDPVDIEPNVMRGIFMARCEMEIAILARMEDSNSLVQLYYNLLEQHRGQASRSRSPRSVYTENTWSRRLAYMPAGPDVD